MVTNLGLFIAIGAVAIAICVFFALGSVIVGILRALRIGLLRLVGRRIHFAADDNGAAEHGFGWSPRSRRVCTRPDCGKANVREAKYCAQCGQRLDG